jgi:hypothetical protein
MYVYCIYRPKETVKLSKKSRNKRCSWVVRSLQDRIAFIINIYQHSKFIQSAISILLQKNAKYIPVIETLLALILVDGRGTITSKERTFVVSLCGNNFMDTIYKFLHRIMFTITLQVSKLTKAVVLNSIPH